ncbi:MAG: hypothetical protein ACREPR_27425 [Brasilonema sp.]
MSTPLHNFTLLHYNNFITIANRAESVRDDNTRAIAPLQVLLQ